MTDPLIEAATRLGSMGVSFLSLKDLARDTPRDEVRQRPGPHSKACQGGNCPGHKPLDYVDARYVMDLLDEVVGAANWQRDHRMTESGKVSCGIGINVDGTWVWKWDGAGETDIEGEKGSFSDAFKRAAVSWGIARDLYPKAGGANVTAPVTTARSASAPVSRPAEQGAYVEQDEDSGVCPWHNKPWTPGKYGPYCTSKAAPGGPSNARGYCSAKP